jgi:hypothetical protein
MISEKDKLAAKSVDQLKAAAKRLGGKLVTPDGKAKTKQQLINTIVMKQRLAGKSMGANTTTKKVVAKKAVAKKPAVKKNVYFNLPIFKDYKVNNLTPTSNGSNRIKITDMVSGESVTIPYTGRKTYGSEEAIDYLKSTGTKIIGRAILNNGTVLLYTKDLTTRLKKKA